MILAQLYAAGGKTEKAIGELEQVVADRPELQLDLARLYALAGRTPSAHRAAAKAERVLPGPHAGGAGPAAAPPALGGQPSVCKGDTKTPSRC